MTQQDLFRLSNSEIYEFIFYYGEVKYGIIVERNENKKREFYIVKPADIKKYNEKPESISEFADKISLEAITSYKPINSNRTYYGGNTSETIVQSSATKLIILGAGASFDYSFDDKLADEKKPPLTNNLFDDEYDSILSKYPGALVFASEILISENLENFFQEQWEIIKNHYDPDLLNKIINTQYYLQDLFHTISAKCSNNKRNNYTTLVSLISKYQVTNNQQMLVTSFNYDTLLEQSINSVLAYDYKKIDDYIDNTKKIMLFKPHGSCNWIRNFKNDFSYNFENRTNQLFSRDIYEKIASYADIFSKLEDEIRIERNPPLMNNEHNSPRFLPQLLIPFTDKDEFVMPKNHRITLEYALEKIDEILIIGWKGTEQVFKELLNKKIEQRPIKITVVNMKDKTIESLFEKEKFSNIEWTYYNTFSEYMRHCKQDKNNFFS
jgi:hypothetical protein